MNKINSLSIVVPVYNEELNIQKLHSEIIQFKKQMEIPVEIIYVNDGSKDNTLSVLEELTDCKIINLTRNFGQTPAIAAGISNATGEYITFLDGDGQNPPSEIIKMVKCFENLDVDLLCGWRKNRKDTTWKKTVSTGARQLRAILFDDSIHDSGCTLKIMKTSNAKKIELVGEAHRFIPILARQTGLRVAEIPIEHRPRDFGQTKYNWRRIFKSYLDMIGIKFWSKYEFRPLHIFGALGLILFTLANISSLIWVYLYFSKSSFLKFGLPVLIALLYLSALQLILIGLLADKLVKNQLKILNMPGYAIENVIQK